MIEEAGSVIVLNPALLGLEGAFKGTPNFSFPPGVP